MRLWKALRAAPHAPTIGKRTPYLAVAWTREGGLPRAGLRKKSILLGAPGPPEYGWTMAVPTIHLRGGVLVGPDTELGKLTQPRL